MEKELISAVEKLMEVTPTQKIAVYINGGVNEEKFNGLAFCETRGIDISNMWKTSRLFQLKEQTLIDFWNYCLQNNPASIESLKDPEKLYQSIVNNKEEKKSYLKFLENLGFQNEEINKLNTTIAESMLNVLEETKKLVKTNIEYLMELGIKNIPQIFAEYYELFLMDYSNFVGIFNKYDREDLIEKLEKNIAIIEYL